MCLQRQSVCVGGRAERDEIVNQLCLWCDIKPRVTAGAVHLRYKCASLWVSKYRIPTVPTPTGESHPRAYIVKYFASRYIVGMI